MLLNLAMIKDKLPSSRILQSRVRKEHPRNLKQIRFYEKDQDLNPDILYLASAEDLPVTPETGQISLLCLGYLPAGYVNQDGVEFLCFRSSEPGQSLFQEVLDIFCYYESFDSRIKDMIIAGRQMRDFQEIALEIFDTPVTVYGTYEKVLMMAYDPNRTENLEYYQNTFKNAKDIYRRQRDLSIFAFIGVYLLSVIDAYVDAELSDFDISKDLSLKLEPTLFNDVLRNRPQGIGLQCNIKF